jgi:hypothetical protein
MKYYSQDNFSIFAQAEQRHVAMLASTMLEA